MRTIKICLIMAGVYILGAIANNYYGKDNSFSFGYFTGVTAVVCITSIQKK